MDPKLRLSPDDGDILTDISQYRSLINHLLYLTLSRPDITFDVHQLSQFLAKPHLPHLQAAHHVRRCSKNTHGQGLFFAASSSL